MSDLVKRLRQEKWCTVEGDENDVDGAEYWPSAWPHEAADRIEELEAERDEANANVVAFSELAAALVEEMSKKPGTTWGQVKAALRALGDLGDRRAYHARAERAEAMLKEAVEALQVIADEKGKCEHCGKIAEGEGRGYVTCDGERDADYRPYYHCRWDGIDAAEFARATLARIAQEGKE